MSGLKALITGKSSGEKKLAQAKPVGFNTGGLSGSFNERTNTFGITRSSALTQGLESLQTRLGQRSTEFANLRKRVSGGFGDVVRSRVDAIRNAASRTIGNLREELGKRRVLGSSFAQREIAGIEASFVVGEERARAEGAIQELGLEATFIDQQFQASVAAAQTVVDQFNFEAQLGANAGANAQNMILRRQEGIANLRAGAEAGQAEFLGLVTGLVAG